MNEIICFQQPDLFKPVQSIIAVLILISIGSTTPVDGSGVLWFIGILSLIVSTTATVVLMSNKDGLNGHVIQLCGENIPWSIIEFIYSCILTLLCAIGFWIAFGYASHVPAIDISHFPATPGHSAGYIFAGVFLIVQTLCYAIPSMAIYRRFQNTKEHETIGEPQFGFNRSIGDEEQGYQSTTPTV